MLDPTPSAALALLEQLQQALEAGQRARIVRAIEDLVRLRPPLGLQWQTVARLAASVGELTLSREAIAQFIENAGHSLAAHYQAAALLTESGDWAGAFDRLRALPETTPDPASNAYSRGTCLLMLGRMEEAREQFTRTIHSRPQSGAAWLGLSMSADLRNDPAMADRLIEAERLVTGTGTGNQSSYYYARGRLHDALGEAAKAFFAFAEGARLQRMASPYDRAADAGQAAHGVEGYSAEAIRRLAARQTERTGRAIFVTGVPRSGTTLVEHILAGHSEVGDGGEIARLQLLARETGGADCNSVERYVAEQGARQAAELWRHWLQERFAIPGRIVDKTLGNTRLLGVAAALLPEAPLVWVTRNPLDRAWSCFRTLFTGEFAWSYDLEDIAHHFRIEDGLLARWQEVLGERLLLLPYEGLVADPDTWIPRLLAHCGLPREPEVMAPHQRERVVATASAAQVRQPIHQRSVGAAEPYQEFLAPFAQAYGL